MLQLSLLVIHAVYTNVFSCGLLAKIKELGKHPFSKPRNTNYTNCTLPELILGTCKESKKWKGNSILAWDIPINSQLINRQISSKTISNMNISPRHNTKWIYFSLLTLLSHVRGGVVFLWHRTAMYSCG